MRSLNYSIFDAAHIGSNYALELSATTAHVRNTSSAQIARALYGKSAGSWYVEWVAYGEMAASGTVIFGVVDDTIDVTAQGIGDDGDGFGGNGRSLGYRMDGALMLGGFAQAAAMPAFALGDVIGMGCDIDNGYIYFWKNGKAVGAYANIDDPMYPACTLIVAQDTDLRALMNAGQRKFEYFIPNVQTGVLNNGWFSLPDGIGLVQAATRPWRSAASDTPANIQYPGGLSASGLTVVQELDFWFWGNRNSRTGGSLRLDNANGRFDALLSQDTRDATVSFRLVEPGGTLATAQGLGRMLVDSVQAIDDATLDVRLRDANVELARALQTRLVLPTADESANAKPWPLSIGAVRSIEPLQLNAADRMYAVNDGPIPGLGAVRDRGDAFDPSAGDYTLFNADGTIQLATEAQGRVTLDMSSLGGDLPVPPADVLNGDGDFDTPSAWTVGTGMQITSSQLWSKYPEANTPYVMRATKHASLSLTAGRVYKATLDIYRISDIEWGYGYPPPTAYLSVCGSNSAGQPDYSQMWGKVFPRSAGGFEDIGEVELVGRANTTGPFWIIAYTGVKGITFQIRGIVLWELAQEQLDDESLIPATLEQAMRILLEERAGWTPDRWSAADAAAIDAATGYAGIGLHAASDSNMTIEQALQLCLDAYGACGWLDDDNVYRVTRLTAPEDATPTGVIDESVIVGDVRVTLDTAPNLTTQALGRKNWSPLGPSEMVTDDLGLPYTIGGGESTG